jgi:hypothetical protein
LIADGRPNGEEQDVQDQNFGGRNFDISIVDR